MANLSSESVAESWTPSTEYERGAVQQQLEHLLTSPLFHSSKRYGQFLRFVVARALEGKASQLKERVLGIEIFDRATDYDTNTDPIVRVTAAEIRKRIDQYYQDPNHSQEIRFFLPAGSYVPQFSWPGHPNGFPEKDSGAPTTASGTHKSASFPSSAASPVLASRRSLWATTLVMVGVALAVILITGWMVLRGSRPKIVQQFWGPFTASSEPTLFCIAD